MRRFLTDLQLVGVGAAVAFATKLLLPAFVEAVRALFDVEGADRFADVDRLARADRDGR